MTVLVFTGAGISAASGIATFRGSDGLWENHSIDEVCNILTWKQNYERVHTFYDARRTAMTSVEPNEAHRSIARIQASHGAVVMTQNIDDLLERGGCTDVVHLHGRIQDMRCLACGTVFSIGPRAWSDEDRCVKCNSRKGVKPGVVFFGETAPEYGRMWKAFSALKEGDVAIVAGTSGMVISMNALLFDCRAQKLLVNLDPSDPAILDESMFDVVLHESAETGLPKVEAMLHDRIGTSPSC